MSFRHTSYGLGQSPADYLALISRYESNDRNVPNYKFGPGFTAQGYYQITNTNWNRIAPQVGIDTSAYPSAMAAPRDLQAKVAHYLLTQTPAGISNWSNYNSQLRAALSAAGLRTSGTVSPVEVPVYQPPVYAGIDNQAPVPIVDLDGDDAPTPTTSILDYWYPDEVGAPATLGVDWESPTTQILVAAAVAAVGLLLVRGS